jgi:O-antigen ligase
MASERDGVRMVGASSSPLLQPGTQTRWALERTLWAERFIAPTCAVLLLFHPTPLSWPAALIGALPSLARLALCGRLWQRTPFDAPLMLLLVSGVLGYTVTLEAASAGIRLAGLAAMVILFAWVLETTRTPGGAARSCWWVLATLVVGAVLLVHVAQPFLRLDRVPPLGWLAQALEPWGLYRPLVADAGALQRYRWYASGAGALAAVGLTFTIGLALGERRRWPLAGVAAAGLFFAGLLLAADNRGSMVAAALTLGALVVWWRPRLLLLAALLVFGTLDAIALGMVQRGLNLRTVVERLEFWQNGLRLATETPWSGVGLGARSVELTYRAAFQPTYPPFNHTHSVYVQGLLEQGIFGLVGLVLLVWAVVRMGRLAGRAAHSTRRRAGLGAGAGTFALLTAGLTEIVALTTLGGALLAVLLGVLAGTVGDVPAVGHPSRWILPRWLRLPPGTGPSRRKVAVVAAVLIAPVVLMSGIVWPLVASPFLNVGTTQLYRGTLLSTMNRTERASALADADSWLSVANALDRTAGAPWRNRALAAAAAGDRVTARHFSDTALLHTDPKDARALFGVGRAYAAVEDWERTIAVWEQAGAGPQLLRLGDQLTERRDARSSAAALQALSAASRLGAPGRLAQASIVRTAMQRGEPLDAALGRLDPLLEDGATVYQTRLQLARELIRAGRLEQATIALTEAGQIGGDPQLPLIQGMLLLARQQPADAEIALQAAVSGLRGTALPVPNGDDPRYWLAVAQASQGKHSEAVGTARAGLGELPEGQDTLRVPYRQVLADSLLALGRADEAIPIYEAGLRIAPGDASLRQGLARATSAAGR